MFYFTSDLHFGHDKDFIYKPRGFNSVEEHDQTIIKNWNEKIESTDSIYILGDLILGDNAQGLEKLKQLNGIFHIICGNHDTNTRLELYKTLPQVVEICEAKTIKIGKQYYFLCHYPAYTANYDDKPYHNHLINLFGHTHQETKFFNENPFMYNVALDAHNNEPISIDEINEDIHKKIKELYQEKICAEKEAEIYLKKGLGYFDHHPVTFWE